MNLLLYKNVLLKSKLPYEKVIEKLNENTEQNNLLKRGRIHKFFYGFINNDIFLITRIINHKNIFIPIIKGKIYKKDKETEINLKISPNFFLLGFITVLFLFMAAIIIIPIIKYNLNPDSLINYNPPLKTLTVITSVYLFFMIMGTITFNIETNKTLEFLYKLLN
ncbi:MAG: hypothetical protein JXB50_07075 [Spirochaetes bacterium]|nr:hypothetical protein [Spirochaetota bacterium]